MFAIKILSFTWYKHQAVLNKSWVPPPLSHLEFISVRYISLGIYYLICLFMVKYDLNGLSLRHHTIYIINIQYLAFILTFKYFSIFLKFSGFSNFTKFKSLESTQLLLWASWGKVRSRRAPHQVQQFWRLSVTNKQPSKQIRKAYIWSLNFFILNQPV